MMNQAKRPQTSLGVSGALPLSTPRWAFVAGFLLTSLGHAFTLPEGSTLEDLGLGARPFGPPERAVRVELFAEIPGDIQQAAAQGDFLYVATNEGQVWRYNLWGVRDTNAFIDVDKLQSNFVLRRVTGGLRGFALHPDFDTNRLVYTMHEINRNDRTRPADYGHIDAVDRLFVLGEWEMRTEGPPLFREVLRVSFAFHQHNAQQIAFNPNAKPGEPDYGKLYLCFGDNGNAPDGTVLHDPFQVGQDFTTILGGIARIDPLNPSALSDAELEAKGLRRSPNERFGVPLDNPFVGQTNREAILYAKGFRNPLSMDFLSDGRLLVADIGQNAFEEINLIESGGNYGWGRREGYFITTYADQETGDFLGANASQRYVPLGTTEEPSALFLTRDPDGTNPTSVRLARTGPNADGITYPVAQYSHDGNRNPDDNRSAIVAGADYTGFWAEELRGTFVFGNFAWDQLYFIELSAIANDQRPAEVRQLPLVDRAGMTADLGTIVRNERVNFRFGQDSYGNVYIISKASDRIYRLEGTPRLELKTRVLPTPNPGLGQFQIELKAPGAIERYRYELQYLTPLGSFVPLDLDAVDQVETAPLADGRSLITYTITLPQASINGLYRFQAIPLP